MDKIRDIDPVKSAVAIDVSCHNKWSVRRTIAKITRGGAVLIVSHSEHDVETICNAIAVDITRYVIARDKRSGI
jgi:ABC-type multidrug transport system ATPase subunit